jgi:hypothetical protein
MGGSIRGRRADDSVDHFRKQFGRDAWNGGGAAGDNCDFFQNNLPGTLSSTDSTAPGGIMVVAGESIGTNVNTIWIDVTIDGCTFERWGRTGLGIRPGRFIFTREFAMQW